MDRGPSSLSLGSAFLLSVGFHPQAVPSVAAVDNSRRCI